MAGYTKADYDGQYSIRVSRHFGGTAPGEIEVRCGYHRWAIAPILAARWANLQPVLNILATDDVCLVGAGFGWGIEALVAESSANVVGVDISDYIAAEKDGTEETELRQRIIDAGLDPDAGQGAIILAGIYDGQPRANVIIINEDLNSNQGRNAVRAALGGQPNVVIIEDVIDDATTDQEIIDGNNQANLFGGAQRVIWITDGTAARSREQLHALTGSEVIGTNGEGHLVP